MRKCACCLKCKPHARRPGQAKPSLLFLVPPPCGVETREAPGGGSAQLNCAMCSIWQQPSPDWPSASHPPHKGKGFDALSLPATNAMRLRTGAERRSNPCLSELQDGLLLSALAM